MGRLVLNAYFKRWSIRIGALFSGGVMMREQKLFLAAISLFFVATGMSAVFVNTFIYLCAYASGEIVSGLRAVVYYNLCMYASMAFFSVVIGIIGKGVNSRVLIFIGLVFYALLYILLIVWGHRSVDYIWLLGFCAGIGTAFVNVNYSVAVSYVTSSSNCDYYLSIQGVINAFAAVLSPLVSGTLLELIGTENGYVTIFTVSLLILLSSIVCCFALRYIDGKKGVTHFGNVFVASVTNKEFRYCALAEFVNGIRDGATVFMIPLLLFTLNMSNIAVGIYVFVFTLIQVSMTRHINSRVNSNNRIRYIFASCVMYAAIGFVFLSEFNVVPIFSYAVCAAAAQSIFAAGAFSAFYDAAYKIPNSHRKNLEILSVREFYINLGRVFGVFALLLIPQGTSALIYTVIAAGILQLAVLVLEIKGASDAKPEEHISIKLG